MVFSVILVLEDNWVLFVAIVGYYYWYTWILCFMYMQSMLQTGPKEPHNQFLRWTTWTTTVAIWLGLFHSTHCVSGVWKRKYTCSYDCVRAIILYFILNTFLYLQFSKCIYDVFRQIFWKPANKWYKPILAQRITHVGPIRLFCANSILKN